MNSSDSYISTDKSKINIEALRSLMKQSYWASKRPEKTLIKSLENSICYGVYIGDVLIGFGRVVTDYATMYYLCDIIIDVNHRGMGLGKKLVEAMISTKELAGLSALLLTKDAQSLYEKYGFTHEEQKCMVRKRMRL